MMRCPLLPAALLLCALAGGAFAQDDTAQADEAPRCFSTRAIQDYAAVSEDTVRMLVNRHDYYDITVSACPRLKGEDDIVFVTDQAFNLCVGPAFGDGSMLVNRMRCPILRIERAPPMTPQEADSIGLPPRD